MTQSRKFSLLLDTIVSDSIDVLVTVRSRVLLLRV